MTRMALLLVLVRVSCAHAGSGPAEPDGGPRGPDPTRIEIYEASFRALFETERWYDPVMLDERICPGVGDPSNGASPCEETFTEAEQDAILAELADLPRVRFVDDAERVRDLFFTDRISNAGLLAVGPIERHGERVTVDANAYCGSLCAHWMTFVLEDDVDGWSVTGTTGPVAIS